MTALQQLYELAHDLANLEIGPLVPPQVNLNGTGAEQLVDQYRAVLVHIDMLMEAMAQASPHGRDWQTLEGGEHLFGICRRSWMHRRQMLEILRKEVEAYAISILEQPAVARKHPEPLPAGEPSLMEQELTNG